MKKLFGIFVLCLSLFSSVLYTQADTCPFTASCDGIRLSWSYTGEITGCNVTGPGIPGGPQTSSCTGTDVLVPNPNGGLYTFGANDSNSGNSLNTTCQVLPATGCAPTGGTYTISASPNPVQVCTPETQGPTTISWTAPVGQAVDVYVNGSPTIAGNSSGSGSGSVTWIQPGQSYVFTLRKASTPTISEATVTVTGTTAGCSVGGTGYCGDGTQQTPNASGTNEQCDDGNTTNGDGCSSSCQTETPSGSTWYVCQAQSQSCVVQGTYSTQQACQTATGQTCYSSNTCNGACGTPSGTQYYTCNGASCDAVPNSNLYATAQDCSNAIGQQCRTTSNCDNICDGNPTQSVYYRCPAQNSGQSCTTSINQPCNGAANCFSVSSNSNAATQCAQYCGSQRYTCGGADCITCGVDGQPACPSGPFTFTTLFACQSSLACQDNGSCSFIASPSSGTAGSTVNLALSSSPDATSCQYNVNPNQSASSGSSGTSYNGSSGALVAGKNVFNATCNFPGYGEKTCISNTVTGTALAPINIGWTPSPVFDPQAKTVTIAAGQTTTSQTLYVTTGGRINCALTGSWTYGGGVVRIEPVQYSSYAVNVGAGNFIYTLACQDSSKQATLIVNPPAILCGNGVVQSPETCDDGNTLSGDGCSSTCQIEPPLTLSSSCNGIVIPNRILTNQPILVTPTFGNTGTMPWTTAFSSISSGWWGAMARYPSQTINQFGTFSPGYNLTAPGTAGFYSLRFRMRNASNAEFGDYCGAAGNWVEVVNPQCSDAVDNDGDGINNFPADPGCTSASDDDETDPAGTAVLKVSANPQLVRQGGSSVITYEVDNCTSNTGAKGDVGDGTWQLIRDGVLVTSGVLNTGGEVSYPVLNISNKTTFTLSCLGTSRSATISVIKISEF